MNRKYALCVGINDYPGSANDLSGCVNDARDWEALLTAEGYEVRTMLDGEATYGAVLTELSRLVSSAGWADRIVFTYSGHGTWIPDRNGDEADGRDEALCLYDFASGGLMLDDTLATVFSGLRYGAGALILSDSCHSGTMTRFMPDAGAEGTPRFVSPASFVAGLTEERAVEMERAVDAQPRRAASLISGCADEEYSYDAWFGNRPNGAFTRAAIDTYKPGISLKAWHGAIRAILPNTSHPQTPQLTASAYRRYAKAL